MNKQYGLQMTYMQAWRSKEYAVQVLRGNPSESYEKLPSYFYMLVLTNPVSVVNLKKTEEDLFMYAFVALYPSIKGWQYCKPVVVVEGTFLESAYRGTLLIASTQDPAGNILPLAYAIVDSENNASWEWFIARFKDAFGEREGMCIVSDRHEGIENAAATLYPQVPHCVCIWHLWNNVKKNYKNNHLLLKDIFFAMAKAYTVEKFDYHMAENIDNDFKHCGVDQCSAQGC
ncbi:PREDICTED: protein FAR1-RELATED SEQUENCE 4-like [Nicotiana attenuata]|uniref:protein FAR1-RELATED SEQUENCE 4-like n=1 Tax=Nicotiana attenuata TaxID=49451 RepID=UPI0009054BB0|nr:PREDICTED: protein FAR1-RELATED SEQUENCE 4-like [Nicotiana attenuata]